MKKFSLIVKGFIYLTLVIALIGIITAQGQTTVSTVASGYGQVGDVAFDSSGNMYFSARYQNKIIKVTPAGAVSTFAGSGTYGFTDGAAATAQFKFPLYLTVDPAGNVYVIDTNNYSIRKITQAGVVSTVKNFKVSGEAPTAILADPSGNLFYFHQRELHKIDSAGTDTLVAGTMGCNTQFPGTGTAACFSNPSGLDRDVNGNLYTVENTSTSAVRKITPNYTVSEIGPRGQLGQPIDVAVDAAGNIYVTTGGFNTIKKVTQAGVISNFAGTGTAGATDGDAAAATFSSPYGLAFSGGNHYVADYSNGNVRKVSPCSETREFDPVFYANLHPDLKAAYGYDCAKLKSHWDGFGLKEGRQSSATFSVKAYLNRYPGLVTTYGATNYKGAWDHWFQFGKAEGRNPAP